MTLDDPSSPLFSSNRTFSWLLVLAKGIGRAGSCWDRFSTEPDGRWSAGCPECGEYGGGTCGAFSEAISPRTVIAATSVVDALACSIDGGNKLLGVPGCMFDLDRSVGDDLAVGMPGRMGIGPTDGGGRRFVRPGEGGGTGLGTMKNSFRLDVGRTSSFGSGLGGGTQGLYPGLWPTPPALRDTGFVGGTHNWAPGVWRLTLVVGAGKLLTSFKPWAVMFSGEPTPGGLTAGFVGVIRPDQDPMLVCEVSDMMEF